MAAAEVPVPSEHFTQIKEQNLKPGDLDEEKEEGGVQRMEAQEGAVEAEAAPCQLLDAAGLQNDQPELSLWVPAESDRRVLTLQTVHLTPQDVHLQGLGWLSVPRSGEFPVMIPQEECFLPLPSVLWLQPEPQPDSQHCVTISIPEELYQPEPLELMHFHLLQQSVPAAEQDQELTPSLGENAALTKVRPTLTPRCLVGKRKVKLIVPRSRPLCDVMCGQDILTLENETLKVMRDITICIFIYVNLTTY